MVERVAEAALVGDRDRRPQRGRDRRVVDERRARVGRDARVQRRRCRRTRPTPTARRCRAGRGTGRSACSAASRSRTPARLGRGERAEQPAVDQHEPGEVAMAGAALEVPRRVGDRHRRAERVPAEDHLAAAAARALAPPRAGPRAPASAPTRARTGPTRRPTGANPPPPQVVAERLVRVAGREALVVLERLRAPVVGPHLQALDALDDLRPDEREVAGAALGARARGSARAWPTPGRSARSSRGRSAPARARARRGRSPPARGRRAGGHEQQQRDGEEEQLSRPRQLYVPRPGIATPDS